MIDVAITHIANQLNQYLRRSFRLNEDVVAVSNILEQDGTPAPNTGNKLLVFLINLEKDPDAHRLNSGPGPAERGVIRNPPVCLNLYLVFAGNFQGGNYPEALKLLSQTVSFFQRRPVFDHNSTPELDPRIDRMVLEVENLNLRDLSTLWGAITGRYLPSVIYKVRMVAVDSEDIQALVPVINRVEPRLA
jgi:hypothetical protein